MSSKVENIAMYVPRVVPRNRDMVAKPNSFFPRLFAAMKKYTKRPFPWCLMPDWVWFAQGLVVLLFISVPCLALILATEVTGAVVRKVWTGTAAATACRNAVLGVAERVARKTMIDPRNAPFLPWTLFLAVVPPVMLYYCYLRQMENGFEPVVCLIYHYLRLGPRFRMFAHYHVLIHKEGHDHRGWFKGPYKALNLINSLWTGLFYGAMTQSYSAGHNKIHHRWHNDADDVHTNIDVDRTYFPNYILWLPRFFYYWTGVSPLAIFLKRAEHVFALRILAGQLWWLGFVALTRYATGGWMFGVAYVVYPMAESIAFLGSMAYLWHGYVEPSDPTNQYINSITILDGQDNIFNEDYHVVHHHAPFVHWTDIPKFYEETKHKYSECTATVFRDCEQGLLVFWQFTSNWDELAKHFVDLNGKLTHKEKVELLVRRLKFHKMGGFHATSDTEDWSSWGTSSQRNWDTEAKR
jgi:fatty acid desaturase